MSLWILRHKHTKIVILCLLINQTHIKQFRVEIRFMNALHN